MSDDFLLFSSEPLAVQTASTLNPWKILAVDDQQDVHSVTRLALSGFSFENRPVHILSAYSGAQAVQMMQAHPDIAMMFLDVVMENAQAGLDVVRTVRNTLHNSMVRIVLRTGQPGQAPEHTVVIEYDINDYKEKTELTQQKLVSCVAAALRGYRDLLNLEASRQSLALAQQLLQQAYTEQKTLIHQRTELLIQSEKLASVGQLAAGVAHEINTPMGYVHSNIGTLEGYSQDMFRILDAYALAEGASDRKAYSAVHQIKSEVDYELMRADIPALLSETREGVERVSKIAQDLRTFSQVGGVNDWQFVELHKGIDSTLNLLRNEISSKTRVTKRYGDIPEIECIPAELNQVFMNLLLNAAQAVAEGDGGAIAVNTGVEGDKVWIEVTDNGSGISTENLPRVFDPFFTTKPIGRGTGLGLSMAFGIVRQHGGDIAVTSVIGTGSTFRVRLPIRPLQEQRRHEHAI